MRFNVTVNRDEDGVWIVECPAIPGCVSQGKTKAEALDNIKEAIVLCLEVRAKEGEIATLSVPHHKEVAKGTLRSLIRSAGLTVEEFCAVK